MKSKLIRILCQKHYLIIVIVLMGLVFYPVYNFLAMADIFGHGQFNIAAVIPFMAVTVAILAGFLLATLINNGTTGYKKHALVSVVGILIFVGLDLLAQHVALGTSTRMYGYMHNLRPLDTLVHSRAILPWHLEDLILSRAPRLDMMLPYIVDDSLIPYSNYLNRVGTIPWPVRIHYYVFSIILVVTVLNWLVNLAGAISEKKKPPHRFLILQGVAVLCYTLAYLLVRVVQYEDFIARHITWGSVLNSAICFVLAAIAVGLYSGSLLRSCRRTRLIIPCMLSAVTVVALYFAQFNLLGGRFYSFGNSIFIAFAIRIAIAVFPVITVYISLRVTPA